MPRPGSIFHFHKIGCVVLTLSLMLGLAICEADISVDARVSRSATTLAEPVQLQIKITGAQRVGDPPDVSAEGLEIKFLGPVTSSNIRVDSSGMHSEKTVIFVYEVKGEQHGNFTIPSVRVEADGQKFKTQPVALSIQQNAPSADGGPPKAQATAELEVKKKALYLGETTPVELKLYVDSRVRGQVAEMPTITSDGLALQKMPEPRQTDPVVRDGHDYNVVTFKTALTPGKAGKILLGPAEVLFNAQLPQNRRRGSSFFDMFGGMDNDPFFSTTTQLKLKANPVELTVKPLPVPGRPVDFSGAVGNFDLSVEGSPKRVNIGDPVTMKIMLSGQGDFDRVTAPVLKDPDGWRSYPPSHTFRADDDLAIKGTKTFEMAVIPETKKTEMPVFEFSYFDPIAGKYITKTSSPAALLVEGSVAAPALVTNAPAAGPTPPPAPEKKAAPTDILGLRYDSGTPRQSFEPIYLRKQFLLAQGVPLIALLGFLGWRLRPRPDVSAHRFSALRRERSSLLEKLRDKEIDHAEFFDHAARVIQIDTALATGKECSGVDAPAARSSAKLDDSTADVIDEIFKTRAELLYAGGGAGEGRVSGLERERVLTALADFGRSHGKR